MPTKPTVIDEYLATVKGEKRAALEKLRKTIRAIVPNAEECISYRIPAFRLDGKVVAGFLATAKGCSYFPFSGKTLATLADEVEGYQRTKGSLHFDSAKPLPARLVRKLVDARMAEKVTAPARGGDRRRRGKSRAAARSRPRRAGSR